jgi:hypothetical protein
MRESNDKFKALSKVINDHTLVIYNYKRYYNHSNSNEVFNIPLYQLLILYFKISATEKNIYKLKKIENFILDILDSLELNILIYPNEILNYLYYYHIEYYTNLQKYHDNETIYITYYYPSYIYEYNTEKNKFIVHPTSYINIFISYIQKFNIVYDFPKLKNKLKTLEIDITKLSKNNIYFLSFNNEWFKIIYNNSYKNKFQTFEIFNEKVKKFVNHYNLCDYEFTNYDDLSIIHIENNKLFINYHKKMLRYIYDFISNYKNLNFKINELNSLQIERCYMYFLNLVRDYKEEKLQFIDYGMHRFLYNSSYYNQNFFLNYDENDNDGKDEKWYYLSLLINQEFIYNVLNDKKFIIKTYDYVEYDCEKKEIDVSLEEFKNILNIQLNNNKQICISVCYADNDQCKHGIAILVNKNGTFIFDPVGRDKKLFTIIERYRPKLKFVYKKLFDNITTNEKLPLDIQRITDLSRIYKFDRTGKCYYYALLFSQYIIKNNIILTKDNFVKINYEFFLLYSEINNGTIFINNVCYYLLMKSLLINKKTRKYNIDYVNSYARNDEYYWLLLKFFAYVCYRIKYNKDTMEKEDYYRILSFLNNCDENKDNFINNFDNL